MASINSDTPALGPPPLEEKKFEVVGNTIKLSNGKRFRVDNLALVNKKGPVKDLKDLTPNQLKKLVEVFERTISREAHDDLVKETNLTQLKVRINFKTKTTSLIKEIAHNKANLFIRSFAFEKFSVALGKIVETAHAAFQYIAAFAQEVGQRLTFGSQSAARPGAVPSPKPSPSHTAAAPAAKPVAPQVADPSRSPAQAVPVDEAAPQEVASQPQVPDVPMGAPPNLERLPTILQLQAKQATVKKMESDKGQIDADKTKREYTPSFSRLTSNAARALAKDDKLYKPYYYSDGNQPGVTYAQQRIWRYKGIETAKQNAERNLQRLEQDGKASHEQRSFYERIAYSAEKYSDSNAYGKDWADCNYFRHIAWDTDYNAAVGEYVPTLTNAHTQAVWVHKNFLNVTSGESESKEAAVYRAEAGEKNYVETMRCTRLGALSDETNGWFSLNFLKDLEGSKDAEERVFKKANEMISVLSHKKLISESQIKSLKEPIDGRERTLKEFLTGLIGVLKTNLDSKVITESTKDKKAARQIFIQRNQLQSAIYAMHQLQTISFGEIGKVISARRQILNEKMLQLIALQLKEHPECIKDGQFKMLHLGLINWKEVKLDDSGWMHDEGVAMEDMRAIFDDFKNKEIVFGDTPNSPVYLDNAGKIHMPRNQGMPRAETVKLQCEYYNISVQKHTGNDGVQKMVNEKSPPAEAALKKLLKFEVGFGKTHSSHFGLASEFAIQAMKAGYAFSTGCSSCKDRGGAVLGGVCEAVIDRDVVKFSSRRRDGITPERLEHYRQNILHKDTPLGQIIFVNIGMPVAKLDTRKVPGLGLVKTLTKGLEAVWKNIVTKKTTKADKDYTLGLAARKLEQVRSESPPRVR